MKYFIKKIRKKAGKTIETYELIKEGDKILVGVSGGKDSLALIDILSYYKRMLPINFELITCYINITNFPYESDTDYLKTFCDNYNIPFLEEEFEIEYDTNKKSPCFICSWNRRKALFKVAKLLNCRKIALGHHLDDVIETLFMNMAFHSSVSTILPMLQMNKWDCKIIRPLSMIAESDLTEYAKLMKFDTQSKVCALGDDNKRAKMKEVIALFDSMAHNAKINLFHSLSNIMPEYLP